MARVLCDKHTRNMPSEPPYIQNIYDDPEFFAGYAELRRTSSGLNEAIEQPALQRLLPPLEGLDILELGCGFGHFARQARELGAKSVTALDPSSRMLGVARASTEDAGIEYLQLGIEQLPLPGRHFDLIVSSLALHYVSDYSAAVAGMADSMRVGGRLLFSVEHPMCTALATQKWDTDEAGQPRHWPVDNYQEQGPRSTVWFVNGVIKHHRTVSAYLNGLVAAGFKLEQVDEPAPLEEAIMQRPDLKLHRRRPPFLVVLASYPKSPAS